MRFLMALAFFVSIAASCQPPRPNTGPQKPGESTGGCIGGGCKQDFSITIYKDGHVTVDNINEKFRDPMVQKPSGTISFLDWLRSAFSYDSTIEKPDGGGNGHNTNPGSGTSQTETGNGTGSGSNGSGNGNDTAGGNTDPNGKPAAQGCGIDEYCKESPPKNRNFEDSEVGKLLTGTWDGIRLVFGEFTGENNKKRREAHEIKEKIQEIKVLRDEANESLGTMNSDSETLMAVVGDLSNGKKFDLTGDTFGKTSEYINAHNRRATRLEAEINDIPGQVEVPPTKPVYDTPDLKSVEHARQYRDYVSRQVEAGPDSFKPVGRELVKIADNALDYSEAAYRAGAKEKGDFAKELAVTALDVALSLTPGVGFCKDAYEAATGVSLLTGKKLSGFERTMAFVGVMTVGYGSALKFAAKADVIADIFKAGKAAEEAVEVARASGKAAEITEAAAKAGIKDKAVIDEIGNAVKDGLPCVALITPRRQFMNLLWLFEDTAFAVDCLTGMVEDIVKNSIDESSKIVKNLTPTKVKAYLANVENVPKEALVKDMESIGLIKKGQSPDGRFMEFVDSSDRVRAKIHPPDRVTKYDHMHIYDRDGNSLDKVLTIVSEKSSDAHIPISGAL